MKVAAAQLSPVHLDTPREETLNRLIRLLKSAARQGATLVDFPELAFTTFFTRRLFDDPTRLDAFFEHETDISRSSPTKSLLEAAQQLCVDICVGYAEKHSKAGLSTPPFIILRN
jgi:predicted amidohydrolase